MVTRYHTEKKWIFDFLCGGGGETVFQNVVLWSTLGGQARPVKGTAIIYWEHGGSFASAWVRFCCQCIKHIGNKPVPWRGHVRDKIDNYQLSKSWILQNLNEISICTGEVKPEDFKQLLSAPPALRNRKWVRSWSPLWVPNVLTRLVQMSADLTTHGCHSFVHTSPAPSPPTPSVPPRQVGTNILTFQLLVYFKVFPFLKF